ncbi:MAG: hypothetical protein WC966_03235 [Bradymonadales bacterium]
MHNVAGCLGQGGGVCWLLASLKVARIMSIKESLIAKGVEIYAPESVVIEDVAVEQIEGGVEIFPGSVLRGKRTRLGRGTRVGVGGGGFYENVVAARGVELRSGVYVDCVLLDRVVVRSHAELREGTLLEEGAELGHTVGLKQSILMPECIVGSLVNFCDALLSGGRSRRVHSEVGSCMALYNYSPWGNKFASLFGDVARGVLLNQAPIFIGGQSQIVSPVHVDFGSVLAAGSKLQRDVGKSRLVLNAAKDLDMEFNPKRQSRVLHKIQKSCQYVGNLYALWHWYQQVRRYFAKNDAFLLACYREAEKQIEAGIDERIKRTQKLLDSLAESLDEHKKANNAREIKEHEYLVMESKNIVQRLRTTLPVQDFSFLNAHLNAFEAKDYRDCIRALDSELAQRASNALDAVVGQYFIEGFGN